MAISADFQAAMDEVDAETNVLAEKFLVLEAKLSTSMSPEDVATSRTFLKTVATRMKGIGKVPDAPIPPGPTPELVFAHR